MSTNYLITVGMLNLGAVLKKKPALTIFPTLNGSNYCIHYLPFGKKTLKETDNTTDNLLLPNHHLIKKETH